MIFIKGLHLLFFIAILQFTSGCSHKESGIDSISCDDIGNQKISLSESDMKTLHEKCQRLTLYNQALEYFKEKEDFKNPIKNEQPPVMIDPIIEAAEQTTQEMENKRKIEDLAKYPELNKKINLSIVDATPVKDIIMEIASMGDINAEIDDSVDMQITLNASDRTIANIFESIASLADLRYTYIDGVVHFTKDTPYITNYTITLLDTERTGTSSYGVGSSFSSGDGAQSGGGGSGISNSSNISNTNEWSVWKSLESGIKEIVKGDGSSYSINKQAGIITVFANKKTQIMIEDYLQKVKKYAMSQILVELKLVELTLDNEYSSGSRFGIGNLTNNISSSFSSGAISDLFSMTLQNTKKDTNLNSAINLFQKFGATKVVASPTINVVNNQQAVLSFAKNQVYFEVTPTLQNQFVGIGGATGTPQTPIIVSSKIKTVPVGIILVLQAVANPDTQDVTINIRPSLSSVNDADSVADPATTFLNRMNLGSTTSVSADAPQIVNKIPVVKKKELDSVLRVKSGGIMVIGGFTEELSSDRETGVPYLMKVPLLGYFFRSTSKIKTTVETIIFIKATIIPPSQEMTQDTKDFYKKFV